MVEDVDDDGFNRWPRGNFLSGARRNELPGWSDFAGRGGPELLLFFPLGPSAPACQRGAPLALSFHIGCQLAGRVAPPALFSETRRIAARKGQRSLFDPLLLPFLLLHSVGATAYP